MHSGELNGLSETVSFTVSDNGGMSSTELDRMETSGLTPDEAAERTDAATYRCVRDLERLDALLRVEPPCWNAIRSLAASYGVPTERGMVRALRAKLRSERARLTSLAARCRTTARTLTDEDYAGNRVDFLANVTSLLQEGLAAESPSPEWGASWYANTEPRFRVGDAWNQRNAHYGHYADLRSARKRAIVRWATRNARNARYTIARAAGPNWVMGQDFRVWPMTKLEQKEWRRRWRLIAKQWSTGKAVDWREQSALTFRQVTEVKREIRDWLAKPATKWAVKYRTARRNAPKDTLDLSSVDHWGE